MSEKNAFEQSFGKNEIKTLFGICKAICFLVIAICLVCLVVFLKTDPYLAKEFIFADLIIIANLVLVYSTVKMFFSIAENLRRLVDNSNSMGQILNEIKDSVKRGEGSEPK